MEAVYTLLCVDRGVPEVWGSYTEIRSGLTADDYIAFPYGKTVKPGAATQESDLSALYGY